MRRLRAVALAGTLALAACGSEIVEPAANPIASSPRPLQSSTSTTEKAADAAVKTAPSAPSGSSTTSESQLRGIPESPDCLGVLPGSVVESTGWNLSQLGADDLELTLTTFTVGTVRDLGQGDFDGDGRPERVEEITIVSPERVLVIRVCGGTSEFEDVAIWSRVSPPEVLVVEDQDRGVHRLDEIRSGGSGVVAIPYTYESDSWVRTGEEIQISPECDGHILCG